MRKTKRKPKIEAFLFLQRAILLVCIVLPPAYLTAEENQAWTGLMLQGPIQKEGRFLLWFDGHARTRNDADDLGVTILRPGIGWRLSENINIWSGYARVVGRSDTSPKVEEDRFWQQSTYKMGKLGEGKFSGRSRLEQRFRNTDGDTGWRFRQLLGYSYPLSSDFSLVFLNEFFWALNDADWGQREGYDQIALFSVFK